MSLHGPAVVRVPALLCAAVLAASARAQEPINAFDAATQPSPGHVIIKEQFRFYSFDLERGPRERRGRIRDAGLFTTLNVGLAADASMSVRAPVFFRQRKFDRSTPFEREEGVGDATVLAKWRVLRHDTAPLDTARFSILGGADIRSGDSPFTSDAYSPLLGAVHTQVAGRHGFNAAAVWRFTTNGNEEPIHAGESTADLLRYDLAYLFRLHPAEFTSESTGALYAVCELNGLHETNGDNELLLSPGLMYEARTWTAELSVQIPVWQRIEHRAAMEYALVAGVRIAW